MIGDTVVYRYPLSALGGDYLRAAVGIVFSVGVLATEPPSTIVQVIFLVMLVIFLAFAGRTALRHMTRVAMSEEAIAWRGLRQGSIAWPAIDKVRLRYYGTRRERNRGDGWLQLTLGAGGQSLTMESTIDGFDRIADRAARAVRDQDVPIDDTTAGNFAALGHLTGPTDVDEVAP